MWVIIDVGEKLFERGDWFCPGLVRAVLVCHELGVMVVWACNLRPIPLHRFPMTKYLFLILMLISPNELPNEGVGAKQESVD